MTVTIKGFQGTISDTDMATQLGAHHLATVRGVGDFAATAVASNRTVRLAAGTSDQAFVKYANDQTQDLPLAPPASGGKWYLIARTTQWSPTNTVVMEAIDVGVTTDGTVPTTISPALMAAVAAVYRSNPGTAGSTVAYGSTQALQLVHVRAADTTLTIFDLRVRRTGAGVVVASNLLTMMLLAQLGQLLEGSLVTVVSHLLPSGGTHQRSSWQRTVAGWVANGRISVNDAAASQGSLGNDPRAYIGKLLLLTGTSRADIAALAAAGYSVPLVLEDGTELWEALSRCSFRWSSLLSSAASQWRPWDSPWYSYTPTLYNAPRNDTFSYGRYRYVAGRAVVVGRITLNGAPTGGDMKIDLPVPPDGQFADNYFQARIDAMNASDGYRKYSGVQVTPSDPNSNQIYPASLNVNGANPGQYGDGWGTNSRPFNEPWAQSDLIVWHAVYDLSGATS